jgi:hypothetical protein
MSDALVVRELSFDLDRVPRHWLGGRKSLTTFLDNLSIFFPDGERFFVAAVRAHADRVADADLARDVRAFCAQEGMHGREHGRYNAMLEAQGYPARRLERRVRRILKHVTWALSKRQRLAVTCALEHFTALLARMLLGDDRLLEGAHPEMAALWRWHALEENEHRSVAFDVYVASGGTYVERAWTMIVASAVFWALIVEQQVRMMRVDGTHRSLAEWRALYRHLFVDPGGMADLVPLYLRYFRPGFHPRDIEETRGIEAFRAKLRAA